MIGTSSRQGRGADEGEKNLRINTVEPEFPDKGGVG